MIYYWQAYFLLKYGDQKRNNPCFLCQILGKCLTSLKYFCIQSVIFIY